jgi:hypothetical protein
MLELRNAYDGEPPRPWLTVKLLSRRGRSVQVKAVVDTGSPFHLVTSEKLLRRCRLRDGQLAFTNYGMLDAGWTEIRVPELQFSERLLTYGSDEIVSAVERSSPNFSALIGLPFLRMFEYGGNATEFWLRSSHTY